MFRCGLMNTTSTLINLIVSAYADPPSEHETQSDSARNTAQRPSKQSIAGHTASCSTPPATTSTTTTTVPTTSAAPSITSSIIYSPGLRPHLTSITSIATRPIPIPSRRRHTDVKLIAHFVEKSDKHNGAVSYAEQNREKC